VAERLRPAFPALEAKTDITVRDDLLLPLPSRNEGGEGDYGQVVSLVVL
jgi:hypothetical protein